jgi:hypothetical protein
MLIRREFVIDFDERADQLCKRLGQGSLARDTQGSGPSLWAVDHLAAGEPLVGRTRVYDSGVTTTSLIVLHHAGKSQLDGESAVALA